ncbi:alpha-L-fucosidase [Cohnella luojiensis]|uniref:alpha-L-fucosidase n=1 Tax=Cohnella luojiensis TaxID=652876 RepID=A0A4Y8LYU6_9BACL|nr:alpha-L-fucosidase [Cohnella luojiensis]TFE25164.1 alpha-L-fucosidase [Cohnella luojiensis]
MKEHAKRTEWFLHDRFGMFIHWGLYAIPARGEWVRSYEYMSNEAYQPYFDEFDPVRYDPKEWARAAKQAGMKYAVLTAKHHDGFCLFDSKLTEYKATNTRAKRDLIKEYVEAFRAEGLKVGLYYSLIDWHHPDYPAVGNHPMRNNDDYKNKEIDFDQYLDYMHGQVKELLTNYGTIDVMWFDYSFDDMTGEKWRSTELVNMIRSIQPDILIDNRLGGNIKSPNPEIFAGDFASPEQIIPPQGVTDEAGNSISWEACITLNNTWGYSAMDKDYKSAQQVIRVLVECVSKNGNLLLNVGPDAKGEIPKESLAILAEVGEWMRRNADSIVGCSSSGLPKPEWGRFTRNGNKLYAHILDRGIGSVNVNGMKPKVKKARLLSDNSEISIETPWMGFHAHQDDLFINLASNKLPDERDTVVELELQE